MNLLKMNLGEDLFTFGWGIIALVAVFGAAVAIVDMWPNKQKSTW